MKNILPFLGILLLLAMACNTEENKTTQTNSSKFTNQKEKIDFLKKYLITHSHIIDAEYDINYYDNSTGLLAGPSDWYISTAIKVNKDSIENWLHEPEKINFPISLELWRNLSLPSPTWNLTEPQEVYLDCHVVKVVYRKQGILLSYYSTSSLIDLDKYRMSK